MGKSHRGRTLKAEQGGQGRNVCPICKRSGVKVLYKQQINEQQVSSCKPCRAALGRGKFHNLIPS